MTAAKWFCICGKPCKLGERCSDRCSYILSKLDSPLGLNMTQPRAIKFFGRIYDKRQQALSKPVTKKRK